MAACVSLAVLAMGLSGVAVASAKTTSVPNTRSVVHTDNTVSDITCDVFGFAGGTATAFLAGPEEVTVSAVFLRGALGTGVAALLQKGCQASYKVVPSLINKVLSDVMGGKSGCSKSNENLSNGCPVYGDLAPTQAPGGGTYA